MSKIWYVYEFVETAQSHFTSPEVSYLLQEPKIFYFKMNINSINNLTLSISP